MTPLEKTLIRALIWISHRVRLRLLFDRETGEPELKELGKSL